MEFEHDPLNKGFPPLDLPSLRTVSTLIRTSDLTTTIDAVAGYTVTSRNDAFLDGRTPGTVDNHAIEKTDPDDRFMTMLTARDAIPLPSQFSSLNQDNITRLYFPSAILSVRDPISDRFLHQSVTVHVSMTPSSTEVPGSYALLPLLRDAPTTSWTHSTSADPRIQSAMEVRGLKRKKSGEEEDTRGFGFDTDDSDVEMDVGEDANKRAPATSIFGAPSAAPRQDVGYVTFNVNHSAQAPNVICSVQTTSPSTSTSAFQSYTGSSFLPFGGPQAGPAAPANTPVSVFSLPPSAQPFGSNVSTQGTSTQSGSSGTPPSFLTLWNRAYRFASRTGGQASDPSVDLASRLAMLTKGFSAINQPPSPVPMPPTPKLQPISLPSTSQAASSKEPFQFDPNASVFLPTMIYSALTTPPVSPNPIPGASIAPAPSPPVKSLVPYTRSTTANSFVLSYPGTPFEEDRDHHKNWSDGVRNLLSPQPQLTYTTTRQDLSRPWQRLFTVWLPSKVRLHPRRPISLAAAAQLLWMTRPVLPTTSSLPPQNRSSNTDSSDASSSISSTPSKTSSTASASRSGSSRPIVPSTRITARKPVRFTAHSSSEDLNGTATHSSSRSRTCSSGKLTSSSITSRQRTPIGTTGASGTRPATSAGSASPDPTPLPSSDSDSPDSTDDPSIYTRISHRTMTTRWSARTVTTTPMPTLTASEVSTRLTAMSTSCLSAVGIRLRPVSVLFAPVILCSNRLSASQVPPSRHLRHRAVRSHPCTRAAGEKTRSPRIKYLQGTGLRHLLNDNYLLVGALLIALCYALVFFTIKPAFAFFLISLVLVVLEPHRSAKRQLIPLRPLSQIISTSRAAAVEYLSILFVPVLLYFYILRIRQVRRYLSRSSSNIERTPPESRPPSCSTTPLTTSNVPPRSFVRKSVSYATSPPWSASTTPHLRSPASVSPRTPLVKPHARTFASYSSIPYISSFAINEQVVQSSDLCASSRIQRSLRPIGSHGRAFRRSGAPTLSSLAQARTRTTLLVPSTTFHRTVLSLFRTRSLLSLV